MGPPSPASDTEDNGIGPLQDRMYKASWLSRCGLAKLLRCIAGSGGDHAWGMLKTRGIDRRRGKSASLFPTPLNLKPPLGRDHKIDRFANILRPSLDRIVFTARLPSLSALSSSLLPLLFAVALSSRSVALLSILVVCTPVVRLFHRYTLPVSVCAV
ncbi:hypothetical protein Hypma_012969 [Hypsizygus marmoreus]|uniref:Uncharacterized protein n=1 Tax=Hypsizygus marmoreus TaxID=39966 RepID=A0A369JDF5_HYPMA|nr:hypothetical protein Hypma_012969 [Hypsizygus marmoreus]